ncbi:MAG TPA: hypothetical protein VEZ44_03865 [bacterium]|nr:hypothetical protein [bacterium]
MQEYTVHLEALGELTEADIDRIIDALESRYAPVVSGGPGFSYFGITLSMRAASPQAAFEKTMRLLKQVHPVRLSSILDWQIHREDTDVTTHELPTFPEFVGMSETAELLGVSKQRAWTIVNRPDFPPPAKVLKATPIWLKRSVLAWVDRWERKNGRPTMWEVGLSFPPRCPQNTLTGIVSALRRDLASDHPTIQATTNQLTVQIRVKARSAKKAIEHGQLTLEDSLREVRWTARPSAMKVWAQRVNDQTGTSRYEAILA